MIRVLWLRWLSRALQQQERGLLEELAGVQYMLEANAIKRRKVAAQLAMAEVDRRARVQW